jgi:Flp pilus assembly pilin Flp
MAVEYAGILAAVSLLAITLSGAYGESVTAVFTRSGAGIAAVAKAAKAQKVSQAGAKTAYNRAPYRKPALKYLYALGWIGGTKNPAQCGLTLLGQDAAREQAAREMRANAKLVAQLKKRSISVSAAANAVTAGVVSACA